MLRSPLAVLFALAVAALPLAAASSAAAAVEVRGESILVDGKPFAVEIIKHIK